MNRKFMPKSDFSKWTPLTTVAEWVPFLSSRHLRDVQVVHLPLKYIIHTLSLFWTSLCQCWKGFCVLFILID